jgi:hypothetical protein
MRKKVFFALSVISVLLICTFAFAQSEATRFYTVNFIYSSPPTMDGVISAGEWDAAEAAQGQFRLLRTAAPGSFSTEDIGFQALCDDTNLYVLVTTDDSDFSGAGATADDSMTFDDDVEIFWDPGDLSENKGGDSEDDTYQIAIPMISGTRAAGAAGPPYILHAARYDATFGGTSWNPVNVALGVDATAGAGVVEIAIPFAEMNSTAGDIANSATSGETDLEITSAPSDSDKWAFNICRINGSDLPLWNFHTGDGATAYFAERPYGEITFNVPPPPTATPTPAGFSAVSLDWCLFE